MLNEFRTQRIVWDTANARLFEPIQAVEGDQQGRRLEVQLINKGEVVDLSGTSLALAWKTRDELNKGLEGFEVVDSEKGIFELYFPTGMLAHKGRLTASLVFYDDNGRIESREFQVFVQPSVIDDEAVESSDSFTALTQAIVQINDFDGRIDETNRQLAQKIDKNVGGVNEVDLSQEVKEIINGDRPLPIAEVNSILTENIVDGQVTSAKLSDEYRFGGEWIDDPDYDLKTLMGNGNYIVSSSVKDNPYSNLSFLNIETTRTVSNHVVLRVLQTIVDSNTGKISVRHINYNTSTSVYVSVYGWNSVAPESVTELPEDFFSIRGTFETENLDLNTLVKDGHYYIGAADNKPIDEQGRLKVESYFIHDSTSAHRWVVQTFSTGARSNKHRQYTRTILVKPSDPDFNGWETDWVELTTVNANDWHGKRWIALGTSKTARSDSSYAPQVASELGLELDNRAVSNGGISPRAGAGDTTMQAILSLEDETDLVTLEVGPNDGGFNDDYELGSMGQVASDYYAGREGNTFYSYLYKAMIELSQRTTARVVVIISTQSWSTLGGDRVEPISIHYTSHRFDQQKAIKEMANLFGYPVIDLQSNNGLGGYFANEQTFTDRIHESELGAKINADYIVKQLVNINPLRTIEPVDTE